MTPTSEQIIKSRKDAGLTQSQAAAMVHATGRAWRYWESGQRTMNGATWELFQVKLKKLRK